ncbi:uncharacterized protein [Prorops nasuta]|uniref:uncharacterized protein n=1 Tax=Prorops nasuta TaxID=863751 RepID=UPI0034CF1971
MARILPFSQLIFAVLVILPGLKSSEIKGIKCYWQIDGYALPAEHQWCNRTFEVGVPLKSGIIQTLTYTEQNTIGNALIKMMGEINMRAEEDLDYKLVCYKMAVIDKSTKKDAVLKGCLPKRTLDQLCNRVNAKECLTCDTNLCNAAGSIKFSLTMIILPILALILNKSQHPS